MRGAEHLKGLQGKNIENVLYKHKVSEHAYEEVKFQMNITKKFKDALTHQANEGARIYGKPSSENQNLTTPQLSEWLWKKKLASKDDSN